MEFGFMQTVLVTGPTVSQNSMFFPSGGRNHRQYSFHLPRRDVHV